MALPNNMKLGLGLHVVEDSGRYRHFQVVEFDRDFVRLRRLDWDRRRGFKYVGLSEDDCYRLHTRTEFLASYHR